MERKKHFFSILRAGILSLTAFTMLFASCGLKDDVDKLQDDVNNINKEITDLKSAVNALETKVNAGGMFVSKAGDGVTSDLVLTFTNGTVTIPKNVAALTIDVDETSNPNAVIITFNKGQANEKITTIPKPGDRVGSIIIMNETLGFEMAQGATDKTMVVRVNPSNAPVTTAANWAIDSTESYASYVNPSKAFSVVSVEPMAPGQYRIGIKALFVSAIWKNYNLVYSAPGVKPTDDPINTTADYPFSLTGIAFEKVDVATGVFVAKQTLYTTSATPVTSGTILSTYPMSNVKSVTYSIETAAQQKFATVAADADMTKFVLTPIPAAFGATELTTPPTVTVSAVIEDLTGAKTTKTIVADVIITKVFPAATTTLDAQPAVFIPKTAAAGENQEVTLIGTVWDALPAGFDKTFITNNTTLTTFYVGADGKEVAFAAAAGFAAATTAPTTAAGVVSANVLKYNINITVAPGNYTLIYRFTDKRTDLGTGFTAKSFDVKVPVTIKAPVFVATMTNSDPDKFVGGVYQLPNLVTNATTNTAVDGTVITAAFGSALTITSTPAGYTAAAIAPAKDYVFKNTGGAAVVAPNIAAAYNTTVQTQFEILVAAGGAKLPVTINKLNGTTVYPAGYEFSVSAYTDHVVSSVVTPVSIKASVLVTNMPAIAATTYLTLKNVNGTAPAAGSFSSSKYTLAADVTTGNISNYIAVNAATGEITWVKDVTPTAPIKGTITVETQDQWKTKATYTVPVTITAD